VPAAAPRRPCCQHLSTLTQLASKQQDQEELEQLRAARADWAAIKRKLDEAEEALVGKVCPAPPPAPALLLFVI